MGETWRYLTSLVELAKDQGLIGSILREYEFLLVAADKWALQNAEDEKSRRDPKRLPFPDPWEYLIEAPCVSALHRDVFRAAQSQIIALRHLSHILQGFATLNTDWYREALAARSSGNKQRFEHAIGKVAAALIVHGQVQADDSKHYDQKLSADAMRQLQKRRQQLMHRGQGELARKSQSWPSWSKFRNAHRLPTLLAYFWTKIGTNGPPGLMFWRNEALTKFLAYWMGLSQTPPAEVKKVRQQLGLVTAGKRNHFVWDVSIKTTSAGLCVVSGFQRNEEPAFGGAIHFKLW